MRVRSQLDHFILIVLINVGVWRNIFYTPYTATTFITPPNLRSDYPGLLKLSAALLATASPDRNRTGCSALVRHSAKLNNGIDRHRTQARVGATDRQSDPLGSHPLFLPQRRSPVTT